MLIRVIAAAACVGIVLQTPAAFEGRIRMRTIELHVDEDGTEARLLDLPLATLAAREDAKVESATVMIKGSMLRTMGGPDSDGAYGFWDMARNTMTLVQPNERSYMEVPMDAEGPRPPQSPRAGGPTPKSLGTRTINGVTATGYEIRGEDVIIRAWMTRDHPGLTWTFRSAIAHREDEEGDEEDAAMAALSRYGWPVLLYTLNRGSLRIEETTGIERSTLPADLFKVPAGFTKRNLGERPN
jgi:hypothetical protein